MQQSLTYAVSLFAGRGSGSLSWYLRANYLTSQIVCVILLLDLSIIREVVMQTIEYVDRIGRYIGVLHRSAQKYINRKMQPFGFTSSDHLFLIHISKNEGINQRSLARMLSIDEAAVTRAVKKLVDGGFVLREKDPEDMRSFSLHLTRRGHEALPFLIQAFQDWDEILLKGFCAEELTSLRIQLKKMTENATAAVREVG